MSTAADVRKEQFLGHPKGLFVLFFTEMWERFSFYGMRALLVLYMTQYLFLDPERAKQVLGYNGFASMLASVFGELSVQAFSSQIYGFYTGLVYFTPFFGGIIADRYLGRRKSVYVGGVLFTIGHFMMASEQMFFFALLFLCLGNGFFKPNISTQVGELYAEGDPRRDGAFTIFYMGINLGAFLSPFVCGTLGQKIGWHYGFGAAGVGMICGLLVYHFGKKYLPADHFSETHTDAYKKQNPTADKLNKDDWFRVGALVYLCIINILFWGVYEQQGNVLQLWADEHTNWDLGFFLVPSSWYQAFNPLFILIFSPLLIRFWNYQSSKKKEPGSMIKMAIGCLLSAIAYLFMVFIVTKVLGDDKINMLWIGGVTLIFTLGEIYLSPIGLSLVTKIAPAKIVSAMMGVWFLSSFFGNYLAALIGTYYEKMSQEAYFMLLAGMALLGFVLFIVGRKIFHKLAHE